MIYLISYIIYLFTTILYNIKIINKYYNFVLILFLCSIIFFRGYVGTDTYAYHRIVKEISIQEWSNFLFIEPFFFFYSKILYLITNNLFITVNLFGCLTLLITNIILYKITKNHLVFYLLYCPIFMLSFTMNGLREGLACTFFLVSLFFLEKKNIYIFFIFFLISINTNYSILYNYLFFFFINNKIKISKIYLLGIVFSIISLFIYFYEKLQPFFIKKFTEYYAMNTPGKFSGISPLIIFISFYIIMFLVNKKYLNYKTYLFLLYNFILFKYASFIGYASLRFLWLNVFIIFSYFIFNYYLYIKSHLIKIMIIGFLGFILEMRIIYYEIDNGSSFLPYKTFFNLKQYDN